MTDPKFIIFTGPMFGGKTTRLLGEVDRYRYKNKTVLAYKPQIDNRYDDNCIVTHNGFKIQAKKISNAVEIIDDVVNLIGKLKKIETSKLPIIVVDESFLIE